MSLRVSLPVQEQGVPLTGVCMGKYQLKELPREKAQRSVEGSLGVWLRTDLHRLVKSLQRPRKEPSKRSRKKKTHGGIMPSIFTSFIKTITCRPKALDKFQVEETWIKPQ